MLLKKIQHLNFYQLLAAGLIMVLAGCAIPGQVSPGASKPQALESNHPRAEIGDVSRSNLERLADGNRL